MFNNIVLDVFIGLIFIFLLYSLLATILQEIVARTLNLRSKLLLNAIRIMLEDRDEESDEGTNPLLRTISRFFESFYYAIIRYIEPLPPGKFIKVFYKCPSIKYLGESSWQSKPSYLEPSNFSATMIKLLRGKDYDGTEPQMNAIYRTLFDIDRNTVSVETAKKNYAAEITPETLKHLRQLYIDSQRDAGRFKSLLEDWFNQTMDRASGWYKRQTQWILFFIGLTIAITFNVDTIAIYKLLAKDKTARESLIQLAINSRPKYDSLVTITKNRHDTITTIDTLKTKEGKDSLYMPHKTERIYIALSDSQLNNAYRSVQSDIDKANSIAALGWPVADSCERCEELQDCLKNCSNDSARAAVIKDSISYYNNKFHCNGSPYQDGFGLALLGWVLTALAISLGAPFWFDLLSKVVQLRTTGPKPDTADDKSGNKTAPASPIQRVG